MSSRGTAARAHPSRGSRSRWNAHGQFRSRLRLPSTDRQKPQRPRGMGLTLGAIPVVALTVVVVAAIAWADAFSDIQNIAFVLAVAAGLVAAVVQQAMYRRLPVSIGVGSCVITVVLLIAALFVWLMLSSPYSSLG